MKRRILFVILMLFAVVLSGYRGQSLFAQTDDVAGTYGTEFWLGFLRNNAVEPEDPTLKITLYVVSEAKVDVIVANGTQKQTISIPEGGGLGKLEISNSGSTLVPSNIYPTKDEAEKALNKGVNLYAKDNKTKFTCYAMIEAGGKSPGSTRDATLILPKDILDKEYFIQTYPIETKSTEFVVVATEDETTVNIVPACATSKSAAGTNLSVKLNKGQTYLVQSATPDEQIMDLSGTTICADKPVAVFTGNEVAKIGSGQSAGGSVQNHMFEQVIPQTMWGTKFYIGRSGGVKLNFIQVTASYDNTVVTYVRTGAAKTATLSRGESLDTRIQLNEANQNVVIEASKPVLCYTYLSSGDENQTSEIDPETGDIVAYKWGNPANALIVPWSHRAKKMNFYTAEIENETPSGKQKHFVQVVTAKSDANKIYLDGVPRDANEFRIFNGDGNMVYANIELSSHGKHYLSTTGDGFIGFVDGITSEARAYQYTLGFDPPKYLDSLFIENQEEVMSRSSYYENGQPVLPYMENKGWYQRQPEDFPIDQQRIDTAVVCDSTVLNFFGHLAAQNSGDEVIWKIYECDASGQKIEPAIKEFKGTASPTDPTVHKITYQFVVSAQESLSPDKRTPFTYYSVDMEKYKKHLICTDLPDDADTLRTMVRVNREYNDTTWRIVCETDTIHFFKECERFVANLAGVGNNKETVFQFNKQDLSKDIVKFVKGDNVYSRKYTTVNGCDSIVTLKLFGCDTLYHYLDTMVCEGNFPHLKDSLTNKIGRFKKTTFQIKTQKDLKEMAKNGGLAPYTETYKDATKTKICLESEDEEEKKIIDAYKKHCKNFAGCPDTFELRLTIVPFLYFPEANPLDSFWCIGDNPNAPLWYRADGSLVSRVIEETDPEFAGGNKGTYIDTVWYSCPDCPGGRCPIERDVINIQIARDEEDTVHICQNEQHYHKYGGGSNTYYYGWDYTTPDKLYPNQAVNEEREIKPPSLGATCQYKHRFVLYVHPAYINDSHLQSEQQFFDTICIAKTAKEYYAVNAPGKWVAKSDSVWSVYENKKIHRDSIHYNLASIKKNANKSFEYIEQLKTKTCKECEEGFGCDSIRRFFLYVADTFHVEDPFELCDNGELDYEFKGKHYYFYSERYQGAKKSPYEIITDDKLNQKCSDKIYFTKDFKGETQFGCDSIRTLKVHLKQTYKSELDTFVCVSEGTYHFVDGKDYVLELGRNPLDTMELSTVLKPCGCDSGVVHHVHILPSYNNSDNPDKDTICQWLTDADPKYYKWNMHPRDGEPRRKIYMVNTSTNKGDSIWTDRIPTDTVAGTYKLIDALQTKTCPACRKGGCDSTTVLLLTIIPTYDNLYSDILSDKDILAWDGVLFAGPKAVIPPDNTLPVQYPINGVCEKTNHYYTKVDALKHSVGTHQCDSFMTYHLVFGETYYFPEYDAVCENCSYTWRDHTNPDGTKTPIIITDVPAVGETKWYYDEYKTVLNFDSVFALQLTGFPTKFNVEASDVCQGEPFTWPGHPGQPQRHSKLYLFDDNGGFIAQISPGHVFEEYGSYVLVDSMLTDTIFAIPGTNDTKEVHCDSIWQLNLTVNPTYSYKYNTDKVTHELNICSNETLLWSNRLWVGYDYDNEAHPLLPASSTTDYDSIVYIVDKVALFKDSVPTKNTIHDCDSITYARIHISPISPASKNMLVHHIGDNDSTWSFGGNTAHFSTLPRVTREDSVPSASVDYSDPTRHEIKKFMLIDTLKTTAGCDSIVWDSVYIHPSYRFDFDTVICSNCSYTKPCWAWRPESPNAERFEEMNHRRPGFFYDSLLTTSSMPYRFDSVYVLNLGIEPGAELNFERDLCKNDTLLWEQKEIFYKDDLKTITVTYQTAHCDSILIMTPHFYDFWHYDVETLKQIDGYKSDSICRYDTIIWISPNETVPHTQALRGEKGEHFDYVPTDTLGWITVYDSLISSAPCKCDSTYTLRYYVKPAYRFYDTLTMCSNDTVYWRGQKLFTDSAKVMHTKDSYQTCGGECDCDSVYYLTLFVNQSYDSIAYDTICGNEKFHWQGHDLDAWLKYHLEDLKDTLPIDTFLYTHYDTKYHKYPIDAPCDSVFQLYLNVRPILTEMWDDTICIGETYALNDKRFTTTGTYTDTLVNSFGCDSFAVVNLQVVPATYFKIEPVAVCADKGGYDMLFTFDTLKGYPPREVRVVYDSLAKACGYPEDTLTLPVVGNIVEMTLPSTGELYVRPNNYSAQILFDNGTCDDLEMQKVTFHFTVNYPDWIIEQHWADAIGILSAEYNGDYTFSAYQWYKNGEQLVGETKPYYFAPDYLEVGSEYSVELTRVGDTLGILSCAITAVKRENTLTPQKPYVSVVPTYVVKANPVVHIMCSQYGGEFKVYNPYGSLIQSGHFTPGEHNSYEVQLPALSGIYLFELMQENGEQRTVKVVVN